MTKLTQVFDPHGEPFEVRPTKTAELLALGWTLEWLDTPVQIHRDGLLVVESESPQ